MREKRKREERRGGNLEIQQFSTLLTVLIIDGSVVMAIIHKPLTSKGN
jgi:hypothetical protein